MSSTYDANDQIGQIKEFQNACVPWISDADKQGYMRDRYPPGGEYIWAGTDGTCNYVMNKEPDRMSENHCVWGVGCPVTGTIPRYKRNLYKGDPKQCCLTGEATLTGYQTCDPQYRGDNRFTNDTCLPHLKEACSSLDKYGNPTCKRWFNYENSYPTQTAMCKGEPNRTNANCYNWCNSLSTDAGTAGENAFKQCELDRWQQGYCSNNPKLLEPRGPCAEYCDPKDLTYSNITNEDWCTENRKELCAKQLQKAEYDLDAAISSTGSASSSQAVAAQAKIDGLVKGHCACYLPQYVYDSYASSLITSMGLKAGKDDLIIRYIQTYSKCMYPNCAKVENDAFRPFTCPPLSICSQNIEIDVTGSTLSGGIETNAAQECIVTLQGNAAPDKDPGTTSPPTSTETSPETPTGTDTTGTDTSTPTKDEEDVPPSEEKGTVNVKLIVGISLGSFVFLILLIIVVVKLTSNK